MRDKDALDAERKRLSANLEKAAKAIEKLTESEKSLTLRLVNSFAPMTRSMSLIRTIRRSTWRKNSDFIRSWLTSSGNEELILKPSSLSCRPA